MDNNSKLFLSPSVSQHGSHMVMSNVVKETKTKCINIDTKFCDEYVNNVTNNSNPNYNISNYIITFPQKINDVKSIKIESIELPNIIYNISKSQENNYFKLTKNGNSTMIILNDGYYTITSLINEINSKINTDVYYGACNNNANINGGIYKSFFYATSSLPITIDFAVSIDGNFDKYNFKSKLGWILGFRNTSYIISNVLNKSSVFGSSTITNNDIMNFSTINTIISNPINNILPSENFVNLNTSKYIYLIIDEFCNGKQNSFYSSLPTSLINKNIIAKIIINNKIFPFGEMITATHTNGYLFSDNRIFNGKIDIQKLNIQLVNENGQIINLNGFDFSMSLKLEYE
jgi:hypothetical protein